MHEQTNQNQWNGRSAFYPRRSALHDIHHAIGRARRVPRTRIHMVPTGPERITWYECPSCGTPARLDSTDKRCTLCRTPAVRREWVRPDIVRAEERARLSAGHARYVEVGNAHPWKPLPEGEYRTFRKTSGPAREYGLARRVDVPAVGSRANDEPTMDRRDGRDEP